MANSKTTLLLATGLFTVLVLASCSERMSQPQQTQAKNPTVTYEYHGDQELLQANQRAMAYCGQYHATARSAAIHDVSDGRKSILFECDAMASPGSPQIFNPSPGYSYRTDQELLDLSRNAELYCTSNGSQRAVSTISTNSDGVRMVQFRCAS